MIEQKYIRIFEAKKDSKHFVKGSIIGMIKCDFVPYVGFNIKADIATSHGLIRDHFDNTFSSASHTELVENLELIKDREVVLYRAFGQKT